MQPERITTATYQLVGVSGADASPAEVPPFLAKFEAPDDHAAMEYAAALIGGTPKGITAALYLPLVRTYFEEGGAERSTIIINEPDYLAPRPFVFCDEFGASAVVEIFNTQDDAKGALLVSARLLGWNCWVALGRFLGYVISTGESNRVTFAPVVPMRDEDSCRL
ncbi:hypothetical protein ACJMQP_04060 [Rhodopseudomonas palustris]